jgi:SAM-dependent methyltransferase
MHFKWDEKTIGWLMEAADYTGFYEKLAGMLLQYIRVRGTLCDMGCGMALADVALAREIGQITCVDANEEVLTVAKREAARRGAENLTFLHTDGLTVQGKWDTVTAMFHGRVNEFCAPYLSKANDLLLFVTHGVGVNKGEGECANATEAAAWLDAGGWRYERQDAVLEFGQPHRSVEEAIESTGAFRREIPADELKKRVMASIQPTGREDFPYYTPKPRSFAIFAISRAENEHLL